MSFKILAITDVHGEVGYLRKLREIVDKLDVNIIVCCGDLESSYAIDELAKFKVKVYAIPGNMDNFYIVQMLEDYGLSIHGKIVQVDKYMLIGVGGYRPLQALSKVSKELSSTKVERGILVTHYPPYETKVDLAYTGFHIGLEEINEFIKKFKPILCLCGHVHESPGIDKLNSTIIVNPGPIMYGRYALVALNEKIDVEIKKL